MKCAICNVEIGHSKNAVRWGPEFAHQSCVIAYAAGKEDQADEPYCADQQNGLADIERQPWRMPAEPFNWPALPVSPGNPFAPESDSEGGEV